ncbi:MAG: MFS transporter [bacterium]|nr:MFS transporter [bacterium]
MVKQTIRLYLLLKVVMALGISFISATYVMFLISKGLNLFEVNLVNCVFFTTLFICEIPTGVVADVFGRKVSFIISCFLFSISLFVYAGSNGIWFFVLAEAIGAVARTFESGAFQAWVVDRLKYYDYAEPIQPIFKKEQQFAQGATIVGALAGAFLADKNLALPWIAGGITTFVAGVLAIFLMKEEYFVREKFSFREGLRSMRTTTANSIRYGVKNKAIRFIILVSAVQFFALQAPNMQWQPLFSQHFDSKTSFGFLYVGISVCIIIGSSLSSLLLKKVRDERMALVVSQAMIGVAIVITAYFSSYQIAILLFLSHEVARGAFTPIKDAYLNDNIPSKERATLISFESISHHIGGAGGLIVSGLLAQTTSIPLTWILSGSFLIIAAIILGKNGKRI